MAGDSVKDRDVFFIGAWRTQQVTDQLLRQMNNQITSKIQDKKIKKVLTKLSISSEGLELLILDQNRQVTRKDKIALENIVDFIDNKYNTSCTLAIVRDKQRKQYTVFVFQCMSDRDAAILIHEFKRVKQQLSGEGYNTNLTPKGKNWTLQQKATNMQHQNMNGDLNARTMINVPNNVRVINTEKQNGDVVVQTLGRNGSISTVGSEVKEELHHLAGEVRDIKRILQGGSQGRAQFQKHYGYRIAQPVPGPVMQVVNQPEYVEREIRTLPVEMKRENLYVKNDANARYVEIVPTVNRASRGVVRGTRRMKSTKGHFITSPTRADYTKRVYESPNPYLENGPRVQPMRVITRNPQQVVVQRPRLYHTQSSDIVQKNIEDVYKSRSLRKMYLPPQQPNSVTDYVNSQTGTSVHHAPSVNHAPLKSTLSKDSGEQSTVHVKYSPDVRTYYDSAAVNATVSSNSGSNGSMKVETTFNDTIENNNYKTKSVTIYQNEPVIERNDNVIVVNTVRENQQIANGNKRYGMYVNENRVEQEYDYNEADAEVHHVRAEFADEYNNRVVEDIHEGNVTIVRAHQPDFQRERVENTETVQTNGYTVIRSDGTIEKDTADRPRQENEGLFGAYARRPDYDGENDREIIAQDAYKYHDDEVEIEEDKADELQNAEDSGLFNERSEQVDEANEPEPEVVREKTVTFVETDVTIEENRDVRSEVPVSRYMVGQVEEKRRVQYNDTVEEIPVREEQSENVEKVRSESLYRAGSGSRVVNGDNEFQSELSAVIARLRHRNEGIQTGRSTSNTNTEVEAENYKFDVDALKAYSAEPDIVIVDSEKSEKIENRNRGRNAMAAGVIGGAVAAGAGIAAGSGLFNTDDAEELATDNVERFGETTDFTDQMDSFNVDEATTAVSDRVGDFGESTSGMTDKIDSFNMDELKSAVSERVDGLEESTSGFADKIDSFDVDEATAAVTDKVEGLGESATDVTNEIEAFDMTELKTAVSDRFDGLEESTSGITDKLDDATEAVTDKVGDFGEATNNFTDNIDDATGAFSDKVDDFGDTATGFTDKFDDATEAVTDNVGDFGEATNNFTDKIDDATGAFSDKVDDFGDTATGFTDKFDDATEAVTDKVGDFGEATNNFTDKIDDATGAFSDKVDDLGETATGFTDKIDDAKDAITDKIDDFGATTSNFTDKIDDAKDAIADKVDDLGDAKTALTEKFGENVDKFESVKDELLQVTRKTEDSVLF